MHFLISMIVLAGVFVVCLSQVKLTWELSQVGVHESPEILEVPGKPASAEEPLAKASESCAMELSDAQ